MFNTYVKEILAKLSEQFSVRILNILEKLTVDDRPKKFKNQLCYKLLFLHISKIFKSY